MTNNMVIHHTIRKSPGLPMLSLIRRMHYGEQLTSTGSSKQSLVDSFVGDPPLPHSSAEEDFR